jgi:hypothetical protein
MPHPRPQRLDSTCAAVAQAGLAVQLAAVLWRLLGSLLAIESLVFVLLSRAGWPGCTPGWQARWCPSAARCTGPALAAG